MEIVFFFKETFIQKIIIFEDFELIIEIANSRIL